MKKIFKIFIIISCCFVWKAEGLCGVTNMCDSILRVDWWEIPPYISRNENGEHIGIFPILLEVIVRHCCGNSSRLVYSQQYKTESDLLHSTANRSIMLPLYGTMLKTTKASKPYIPLVESPGIVYFQNTIQSTLTSLIVHTVSKTWPIICFVVVYAMIAGIFIWALDCYRNPNEFPVSFFKGSWKGFWWAMVSITTVGYGDRAPKSIMARIFSCLWVTMGLVTIAVFQGGVTAHFTSYAMTAGGILKGENVVVLSNSEEKAYSNSINVNITEVANVTTLYNKLSSDAQISGALLDAYVAGYYPEFYSTNQKIKVAEVLEHRFSYGIMLSEEYSKSRLERCMRRYISLETDFIIDVVGKTIQNLKLPKKSTMHEKSRDIFDPNSNWFLQLIGVCTGILGIFFILAIAQLIFKWKCKYTGKELPDHKIKEKTKEELLRRQCFELQDAMETEVKNFYRSWSKKKALIFQMDFSDRKEGFYYPETKHQYVA